MKKVVKKKNTIDEQIQAIEKRLQLECPKCDGTGKPRTKTGEPAKTGKNVRCAECRGTGIKGYRLDLIDVQLADLKKSLRKIKEELQAHINRQTAEIRVLPEGHNPSIHGGTSKEKSENGWEDYTGVFFIDPEDEKEIVLRKARRHFEEYFENGPYHRNRKFGVFLTAGGRSGKHLVEEMETGD
jgi:hypothetical protein